MVNRTLSPWPTRGIRRRPCCDPCSMEAETRTLTMSTDPSSTLHPYAFAITAHNMTDPIGAKAKATMTKSTSKYQNHGNLLYGLSFMTRIPNHTLGANIVARLFQSLM